MRASGCQRTRQTYDIIRSPSSSSSWLGLGCFAPAAQNEVNIFGPSSAWGGGTCVCVCDCASPFSSPFYSLRDKCAYTCAAGYASVFVRIRKFLIKTIPQSNAAALAQHKRASKRASERPAFNHKFRKSPCAPCRSAAQHRSCVSWMSYFCVVFLCAHSGEPNITTSARVACGRKTTLCSGNALYCVAVSSVSGCHGRSATTFN